MSDIKVGDFAMRVRGVTLGSEAGDLFVVQITGKDIAGDQDKYTQNGVEVFVGKYVADLPQGFISRGETEFRWAENYPLYQQLKPIDNEILFNAIFNGDWRSE